MGKTGYYLFNAGINYRDDVIGINELRDANNLHWRGNLERRKGYQERLDDYTAFNEVAATTNYSTANYQIVNHIKLDDGTTAISFIFMAMGDTAGATNAITIFQSSGGLPTGTGTTYTCIEATGSTFTTAGVGGIIPWDTSDPFSAVAFDDKIWFGLGDPNPYVLFWNGSSWTIHEYPLCCLDNNAGTGSVNGYNIIPGSTDATTNTDWGGTKIVGAANHNLFISDGRRVVWAPSDAGVRPDYGATYTAMLDRTSAVRTNDASLPGGRSFLPEYYLGIDEQLHVEHSEPYKKYLFLYGEDGIVSIFIRGQYNKDYDLVVESQTGVYGKMVATEKGIFFVSKDGIYGYDGQTATELSKKINKQLEAQNASFPTDYDDCTLAYHDGLIWISFPNGTNKEIYVFDPDNIYDDERGDSHAPFFKYTYANSTSYTAFGFNNLKEYDNYLYGVSSARLYQLDFGGLDNQLTTGTSGTPGIPFAMRTGYLDQENPNINKTYRQVIPEVNEGWADGSLGDITTHVYDFQLACSVQHSTGKKFRGISTQIDLEYTTDGGHVSKSLNVPETTAGYILDGNNISVELIGESSNCIPTTADVKIFGFSLDWEAKGKVFEEVSS